MADTRRLGVLTAYLAFTPLIEGACPKPFGIRHWVLVFGPWALGNGLTRLGLFGVLFQALLVVNALMPAASVWGFRMFRKIRTVAAKQLGQYSIWLQLAVFIQVRCAYP